MTGAELPPDRPLEPDAAELAARLSERRPVPQPRFRGALERHLSARDPGYGPRPARLRLRVVALGLSGGLLLGLGALVATGVL